MLWLTESESESEDVATEVLRPVLHPVRRRHRPHCGDEQRAAACHEDALQVRPEGFFVQTAGLAERARQVLAHVQRPGLPGDARGPALWCGYLQRTDEDAAEGLQGEFTLFSLSSYSTVTNNIYNLQEITTWLHHI